MTMLFDIEQYRAPDSQNHKGDWDGVKYDPAWDDGSAFPNTTSKASSKETERTHKTDCWYSPPDIVELVMQVLGEINLDPCADDGRHISAAEHYTKNDNGLEQPWCGKVYMNPPYSHPGVWMKKLQLEFETGNVDEVIALVPAATDTNWLSPVLKTQPVCFWKGRIKFLGQDYQPKLSARQSHVLVYWGNNWQRFREVFEEYGVVYFPISASVPKGISSKDVVLPVEQISSNNGKVDAQTVLPVNKTSSTNGKVEIETVLPVNKTSSTNVKADMETVLPVNQISSNNGKVDAQTVLPVNKTSSTNGKVEIETVLPVNKTSSTNGKVEIETVLPVNKTSSTNVKADMETVLPVNQTSSTNGKVDAQTVLPVNKISSTDGKTDIETVLPVNQTSSTNRKTDIESVLPVKKTSSTKRRRRGEGTGRIHRRTITKKNGKQYQQAWYDWQLTKGKTIFKSTYIPKRLLSQVQQLEDYKTPVREILKVLGVNQ